MRRCCSSTHGSSEITPPCSKSQSLDALTVAHILQQKMCVDCMGKHAHYGKADMPVAGGIIAGAANILSEARKLGNPTGEIAARKFVAHRAFAPEESNDAVYADAIAPLVACVQGGGAALALAYGQTSAGKTFTIEAVQSVAGTALLKSGPLRLSCFEICGEKCSDLLTPGAAVELCDDGTGAVVPTSTILFFRISGSISPTRILLAET